MEYHDRVLKCSEAVPVVFTAGEQMFFADKGFKNDRSALKELQSKAGEGREVVRGRTRSPMRSETNELLAMRERNDGSLPANAGAAGLMPRMLPATEGHGSGIEPKRCVQWGSKERPCPI